MQNVQIVTVSYNSSAIIGDMLQSVPPGVDVVIVDNASSDLVALRDLAHRYNANLVENIENLGFGAACNQGAAIGQSEFLLFLNPDAQLNADAISALLNAAQQHPDASVFIPQILDRKGNAAFRRRSRLLPRQEHWSGAPPDYDTEIPILNGAAFFVRRENFHAVDGFDELIFLYHEDDDLGLRLKQKCGPIWFVQKAIIRHAEGSSTVRSPAIAAFKAFHMAQSAIYTMRKHKRPFAFNKVLAHAVLQLLSPINLLSPRKRAKNIGFLKGCLKMVPQNKSNSLI